MPTLKYRVQEVTVAGEVKPLAIGDKEYAAGEIVELEQEAQSTWDLEAAGSIVKEPEA